MLFNEEYRNMVTEKKSLERGIYMNERKLRSGIDIESNDLEKNGILTYSRDDSMICFKCNKNIKKKKRIMFYGSRQRHWPKCRGLN